MSSFYNPNYDLEEAAARRRRAVSRRGYEFDVSDIARTSQQQITDLNREYARGLEPRATGFSRRGLGRSGLFRRAMSDYASQQQRALGDITAGVTRRIGGLQLQEQQSQQELQDTLDAIARAKAQEIFSSAANLKAWAPLTGLYS
jgi:hypothetical protein